MRMVKVQMMEKSEKATRHSRSTTAAANFHSLQMASPSSCSRKRLAMYCTSSRIWEISGSCSSSSKRVCSGWMPCWEEPPGPHTSTLGSEPGGSVGLSMAIAWQLKYRFMFPLAVAVGAGTCPGIVVTWMVLVLLWWGGWEYLLSEGLLEATACLSSPGFFMRRNQAHQLSKTTRIWRARETAKVRRAHIYTI